MQRGITGGYEITSAGGEQVRAFIPHQLPPHPPVDFSNTRQRLVERTTLALGRLDSITLLLPDPNLFLYAYVRLSLRLCRACRKTTLRVTGRLLACLFPLYGSCFFGSVCPDVFFPHQRRSLGLLNPYLSVFSVPMIPSVLPRSLLTVSRTASATRQAPLPLG